MESELALHSAIVALSPVTVAPALFGTLLSLHAVDSLLQLLSHENADVACAVLDLLHELTDPSLLADEEQEDADAELIDNAVNALVDALVRCTHFSHCRIYSTSTSTSTPSIGCVHSYVRWRATWWKC